MNDIAKCEQRLSLALARIDQGIDRLQEAMRQEAAIPDPPADPQADADRGSDDPAKVGEGIADLHRRQQAALDNARARLADAGAEAARLAAANDQLVAANRALIEAQGVEARSSAAHDALEAEIEALQAARASEIAQMGDILTALEAMLGIPEPAQAEAGIATAGFDSDVETLPQEGRILRFGRDDGGQGDDDSAGVPADDDAVDNGKEEG